MTTTFRGWGPPPRPARDRALTYDAERMRLTIREGGVTTTLYVEDVSIDGTRAYRLVALDDDVCGEVTVVLDGRRSQCECAAAQKWGRCIHADALVALDRAGRLA
jgi:hypothetical protein